MDKRYGIMNSGAAPVKGPETKEELLRMDLSKFKNKIRRAQLYKRIKEAKAEDKKERQTASRKIRKELGDKAPPITQADPREHART